MFRDIRNKSESVWKVLFSGPGWGQESKTAEREVTRSRGKMAVGLTVFDLEPVRVCREYKLFSVKQVEMNHWWILFGTAEWYDGSNNSQSKLDLNIPAISTNCYVLRRIGHSGLWHLINRGAEQSWCLHRSSSTGSIMMKITWETARWLSYTYVWFKCCWEI